MSKTLAEIYTAAADAIRERGHAHGKLIAHDGSMCIWGAISFVVDNNPTKCSTRTYKMLHPLSEMVGTSIIDWNNEIDRTKRQVVGLLRRAARKQSALETANGEIGK